MSTPSSLPINHGEQAILSLCSASPLLPLSVCLSPFSESKWCFVFHLCTRVRDLPFSGPFLAMLRSVCGFQVCAETAFACATLPSASPSWFRFALNHASESQKFVSSQMYPPICRSELPFRVPRLKEVFADCQIYREYVNKIGRN
jgi:hypothetical protein